MFREFMQQSPFQAFHALIKGIEVSLIARTKCLDN